MGILAIVDTFLLYKICERRYNRNVGLFASVLLAVMHIEKEKLVIDLFVLEIKASLIIYLLSVLFSVGGLSLRYFL
jgi:hypothetical protein